MTRYRHMLLVNWSDGTQTLQRHRGIPDADIPVNGEPGLTIDSVRHFCSVNGGKFYVSLPYDCAPVVEYV